MKKLLLFALMAFSLMIFINRASAQLPAGSYGENFTMQDYLGTTYSLYTYTDAGKPVIMDVSAVWCGPCWSYHQSGALETYYNTYGPPGDNSSMVLWIEGDQNSAACLQGTGCSTQGNWTTGTTFPMILTCAPNNAQVVTDYAIAYFPTIYLICPNRTVTEVGQVNAAGLHTAALGCPAAGANALDAAVFSATVPSSLCAGSVTPTFTLQNYGSTTLTSASIVVKLDGSTVNTVSWTGSLAKYEIDDVVIPAVIATEGAHTLTFEITSPNGGTDADASNNTKDITFNAGLTLATLPVTEGFQSTAFPPSNWMNTDVDNNGGWVRTTAAGGFGTSTASALMSFYSISSGTDYLNVAPIDLSSASSATLTFDVAYAQYSTSYVDYLKVDVSTNCGTSWTTLYNKSGSTLATNGGSAVTSSFVPTAAQWRAETVDLASYIGQPKVFIRYTAISGYGNNLYIDNVNITSVSSIEESNTVQHFSVYPNPASGNTSVIFSFSKEEKASVTLYDMLGQSVVNFGEKTYAAGTNTESFSTENLLAGVYYVTLVTEGQKNTQKIIVVK